MRWSEQGVNEYSSKRRLELGLIDRSLQSFSLSSGAGIRFACSDWIDFHEMSATSSISSISSAAATSA